MMRLNAILHAIVAILLCATVVQASSLATGDYEAAIKGLGAKSRKTITASAKALGTMGKAEALPALEALLDRRLRSDGKGGVYIVEPDTDAMRDALTGEPVSLEGVKLKAPVTNNKLRRILGSVIAQLRLSSSDEGLRLAAAFEFTKKPKSSAVETIRTALEIEGSPKVKEALELAVALVEISSGDKSEKIAAANALVQTGNPAYKSYLLPLVAQNADGSFVEVDKEVRESAEAAISSLESREKIVSGVRNVFFGMSLGSVLLLAALGLSITFGLMGVINMAHGEMLMLGAYSTYVIQTLFQSYLPGWFDFYLVAAVPAAFCVTALVGIVLERTIIRHLYGRPLETLLATWGISLLLIQAVRTIFGAQNVQVANPSWLTGGVEVTHGLMLTYNRLAIILFVIFGVGLVWFLLNHTSLGLKVRAVTQNRSMASCMGIPASKVDAWTFGLGSGIAGLGGVALSQIGNVGPELGQGYIVDSFMVVVLGGVGKIAGTVCGAMGLGLTNKILEPWTGAVLGKIFVLAFLILFIQKRPQGIFAMRGRAAEA